MRKSVSLAIALFIFVITTPLVAQKEDPAWITSPLTAGGTLAAKKLAGFLYARDCKTVSGGSAGFICGVLGDFSEATKAEWEANVTKKLDDISKDVKAIADQQKEIERLLRNTNKEMKAEFDALAGKVIIGNAEVKIKSLWNVYARHFENKTNALAMNRETMVNFAKEIMKADLHERVRELNTALTDNVVKGKPYLQFPFDFYRTALQTNRPKWESTMRLADVYTIAEQQFLDYYMLQQRALILYLWAAFVLENECRINKQCMTLPITRDDFDSRVKGYTKEQIIAFNAGLDWFILATSPTRTSSKPDFLGPEPMPILARANLLTATILSSSGAGLWARIYAMGDAWDGTMQMGCGGLSDVKPAEQYQVPVGGSGTDIIGNDSGPLDWWTVGPRSDKYNVVHFATLWTVYHYSLPNAKVGNCGSVMGRFVSWKQSGVKVEEVAVADPTPEDPKRVRKVPMGSLVGIGRAGGTYALMSSNWDGMTAPEGTGKRPTGLGNGNRKGKLVNIEPTAETEWFIGHNQTGKIISLYTMGRGEYDVTNLSSRIQNKDKIQVWQTKNIEFPEGGAVTLHFVQGNCNQCKNTIAPSILRYDVENNPLPTSKGSMKAKAAIYFDDANGGATNLAGRGVVVEDTYADAGDRKQKDISGLHLTGIVRTERNKPYRLTYLIDFDLLTYGMGTNATEYMYAAQLTPSALYLTK